MITVSYCVAIKYHFCLVGRWILKCIDKRHCKLVSKMEGEIA